jgi:hypothetical protein
MVITAESDSWPCLHATIHLPPDSNDSTTPP